MIALEDRREFYKSFFTGTEAGKDLLELMGKQKEANLSKAMTENSLDYLGRASGNQEIIDLVVNVLKTEKGVKD